MSAIIYIASHADEAEARLPEQYKDQPNMVALARLSGDRMQPLEDTLNDMIEHSGILSGHDFLLDQNGAVVVQKRNGSSDDTYKLLLAAKVGVNVSKGTPENLIKIYKALMQADQVMYRPVFPAGFSLTAINPDPLGSPSDIRAAINSARMAGVGIDYLAQVNMDSFSFSDDPDPNGQGFGDYNDASLGGYLAEAI